MPLYLSPYTGSGTKVDPFRPIGSDQPGWSAIDLRADGGQSVDGSGIPYALLWLPAGSVEAPQLIKIGNDKLETLSANARNFLTNRFGLDFSSDVLLSDIVETLLLTPPANGWKALRPAHGRLEAWLNHERWVDLPIVAGGSISDSFTRADETPVAAPWTRLTGSVGGDVNLTSNALSRPSTTGDAIYYYNNPAGWLADQSSQMTETTAITTHDWSPAVRIGSDGFSGYVYAQFSNRALSKFVTGTYSIIEVVGSATSVGTPYKIAVAGSTISYFDGGIENANSPATDTALATAGVGAGFHQFNIGGTLDDFLATGELADIQRSILSMRVPTVMIS